MAQLAKRTGDNQPNRDNFSIAKNTINWFDDRDNICMGDRRNPAHVKAWRLAWEKVECVNDNA